MALNGKIISRLNEEERLFVRQLIGIANNLNQLTKKGHQEGLLTAVLMFEKYKNLMDELLEKLKKMISKVIIGKTFYGACRYVCMDQKKPLF